MKYGILNETIKKEIELHVISKLEVSTDASFKKEYRDFFSQFSGWNSFSYNPNLTNNSHIHHPYDSGPLIYDSYLCYFTC